MSVVWSFCKTRDSREPKTASNNNDKLPVNESVSSESMTRGVLANTVVNSFVFF